MKRFLTAVAAVVMLAVPATAQTLKVDKDGILKKIARSDADIENPKKMDKAATWIDRGKVFVEAATQTSYGLFSGMSPVEIDMFFGQADMTFEREFGGYTYTVYTYPYFHAYFYEDRLMFWEDLNPIVDNGLDKAFQAYQKAYELDGKSASKLKTPLMELSDFYKQDAGNSFAMHNYVRAAEDFEKSYEVQKFAPVNFIDTAAIYNAGFLYTISLQFAKGLPALQESVKLGYMNDGDVYYYLFHCYYGLERVDEAMATLLKGLAEYPDNNKIVEGLVGLYAETDQDPRDILPIVQEAIAKDPENPGLWSGLGRIYDKLGDTDKAIECFEKVVEMDPDDANSNFNLGLILIQQGDRINAEISQTTFTKTADFNEAIAVVYDLYSRSIPPLEKALSLYPGQPVTIELLKNVTFRLREQEEGMQQKYEMYDEMFKQVSQE